MKLRYLLLLAAVVTAQFEIPEISATQIPSRQLILLYAYHPSSISCVEYTLEFNRLGQLPIQKQYELGKINCAIQARFCHSQPRQYPAIYLYAQGQQIIYEGEVTAQKIDDWVNSIINQDVQKLSSDELKKKQGKEKFILVGNLSRKQKVFVATIRATRFIDAPCYEISSSNSIFGFYPADRKQIIEYSFTLDPKIIAYQLFHRTRKPIMPLTIPHYLEYLQKQADSDEVLIYYNHHDQFNKAAAKVLENYCHQFLLTVLCFSLDKGSQQLEQLAAKQVFLQNRSSLIFFKQNLKKGYLYTSKSISYQQFSKFVNQTRQNKRPADYDTTQADSSSLKYAFAMKLNAGKHKAALNKPIAFVKYYSPNCRHCSKLAPKYDEVAQHFKNKNSSVIVAVLDAEEEIAIADQQKIQRYPTLRLFIKGQAIDYEGELSTQAMIDYLNDIAEAQLTVISNLEDIKRPALVISGIEENSTLHKLPGLFNSIPIYWLKDEEELKINLYQEDGSVKKFAGRVKLTSVLTWLQEHGEPVLANLGSSRPSKKLKMAIRQQKPVLGLINKGQQGLVQPLLNFLNSYCKDQKDFICGVVNKGEDDYDHLVQWINDPDSTSNRLVWMDFSQLKSYIYSEDLQNLNQQKLNSFIQGIKDGTVSEQRTTNQDTEQETEKNKDQTDEL